MHRARTVSFKLGGAALQALDERSRADGVSPGHLARRFTVASLEGHELREVLHRLDQIQADHQRLRIDLADALETFLLNMNPDLPEGEVRKVREFFTRTLRW